jgi:phosphoglycerate dehydrogenase-like enzyme
MVMNGSDKAPFRVALTADFYHEQGNPKFRDVGLSLFDAVPQIQSFRLEEFRKELTADQLNGVHGVIVLTPAVTRATVLRSQDLLAVGRFGVGYDGVDVQACTDAGVVVFITAGAVDRSVAEATVGWMIALTHHMRAKDILVRTGRWNDRSNFMGCELRGRTFGTVGLGGIARATVGLLASFGMNQPLAFDPYIDSSVAPSIGARQVGLNELMGEADFISIHCPLNEKTRNLIGEAEIQLMKPTAYLLNTARGGIVNEDALFRALKEQRIAGAAIDCFADEPVTTNHPFAELDNVLLAPHSIAWTDELFRDIGRMACQGMIDLAQRRRPKGVVNPAVFERPEFDEKWQRLCKLPKS